MADEGTSRRMVLGGAGAMGLAMVAAPASAQQQGGGTMAPTGGLKDPRTKYTNQPFAEQRQPWPAK